MDTAATAVAVVAVAATVSVVARRIILVAVVAVAVVSVGFSVQPLPRRPPSLTLCVVSSVPPPRLSPMSPTLMTPPP